MSDPRELYQQVILEPRTGGNLMLSIDSDLQAFCAKQLEGQAGAVVVLQPDTGKVLALVSQPTYDNNLFVLGIPPKKWKELRDDPMHPIQNRVSQSVYPPGSTFKLLMAACALSEGMVKTSDTVVCTGSYRVGDHDFHCWKKGGHGSMDMRSALVHSCDVYFYVNGQRAGPLAIEKYARAFRLGQTSGIALPDEKPGNVFGPSPRAAKKSYWFIGDTLNLAIGQGETLMTPMQAAGEIAAVANGGIFHRPYYVDRIVKSDGQEVLKNKPEVLSTVQLKPSTWALIREGLHSVVVEGTGQAAKIQGAEIYGKTGTAQNPQGKDHAWFVAYATVNNEPAKIAVAVLVEHGEHGASAAAPIAKAVIEAALRADLKTKNVPFEGPLPPKGPRLAPALPGRAL